jgi:hypothetical protein
MKTEQLAEILHSIKALALEIKRSHSANVIAGKADDALALLLPAASSVPAPDEDLKDVLEATVSALEYLRDFGGSVPDDVIERGRKALGFPSDYVGTAPDSPSWLTPPVGVSGQSLES